MNKHKKNKGIQWIQAYGRDGYTANPTRGCVHGCQWEMPNGEIAECYALTTAERINLQLKEKSPYKYGFGDVNFFPNELLAMQRKKKPSGIFVGSMTDIFQAGLESQWVHETLNTIANVPQHIIFMLTKHAPNFKKYGQFIAPNVWQGISAPPTHMFGSKLDFNQSIKFWENALHRLTQLDTPAVRWLSIEPLSWDTYVGEEMVHILGNYAHKINWAVIGAASHNNKTYQPDSDVLSRTFHMLKAFDIPVFFKSNLDTDLAIKATGNFYREFPPESIGIPSDMEWLGYKEGYGAALAQLIKN